MYMNQTDRTYTRKDGPKRRRRTRRDHREGGFTQWSKGYHPARELRLAIERITLSEVTP